MIRRPPRSTRTDTLFPYTTLFRSGRQHSVTQVAGRGEGEHEQRTYPARLPEALGRPRRGGHGRELRRGRRSEEHTSELQSLMRISYAVFCLKKKKQNKTTYTTQLTDTTLSTPRPELR